MNDSASSKAEELTRAEQLIRVGSFEEALQVIDELEQRTDLTSSDLLTCQTLKGNILNKLGRFEDALTLADRVLQDHEGLASLLEMVDVLLVKAEALWRLGRFDEGLDAIAQGEEALKKMSPDESPEVARRQGSLFIRKGTIYHDKGDLDRTLEYYEQSFTLFERGGRKEDIAEALNNIGTVHDNRGDWDRALEYYEQSLALREEVGNRQDIAKCLNNIGLVHLQQGNMDRTIEYLEQALALFEETGNKQHIALSLSNLGAILQMTGDLNRALECYQQSLVIFEEIGNKQHIAMVLNNLGAIHHTIGNLDLALEYYEESLALVEEIGNKQDIALSLTNTGLIYWQRGADFDHAIECLEKSLMLLEEAGNSLDISQALYSLFSVANDRGSSEQARWYLERLLKINNREDNKLIRQLYRVAQALVLKKSTRKRDTEKAKLLLRQVVEDEVLEHDLFVEAMLNLCDSLIADLRASGEQEVLEDVRSLVSRLLEVVNEQHSHALLAQTYLLQSKLALLELDLKEAQLLLTQAQLLADRTGMVRLAMKISREHDSLLERMSTWERFIQMGASLKEREDSVGLREMVLSMIRKRVTDDFEAPDDEPIFLLIQRQTDGLNVFSTTFLPENTTNEELIRGLVARIETAKDVILSQSLNRTRLGTYTLLVQSEAPLLVCYVFSGQSFSAQKKISRLVKAMSSTASVWQALTEVVDGRQTLTEQDEAALQNLLDEAFSSQVTR